MSVHKASIDVRYVVTITAPSADVNQDHWTISLGKHEPDIYSKQKTVSEITFQAVPSEKELYPWLHAQFPTDPAIATYLLENVMEEVKRADVPKDWFSVRVNDLEMRLHKRMHIVSKGGEPLKRAPLHWMFYIFRRDEPTNVRALCSFGTIQKPRLGMLDAEAKLRCPVRHQQIMELVDAFVTIYPDEIDPNVDYLGSLTR